MHVCGGGAVEELPDGVFGGEVGDGEEVDVLAVGGGEGGGGGSGDDGHELVVVEPFDEGVEYDGSVVGELGCLG